ncbi:isoaspartyl peptidase/L-asparaginase family protein [Escherichia coli]|uniref:isoaspartyl peptidase/L-asparaginase family protein n=1 Tax=Escherichia coli TaxID=562 RepID=UPI0006A14DE8|nr:isoaspartyl peptidase/L-asparaginase [Escherichia coli]CTW34646.1 asparaginase family protein [Escherichia coli]
MKRSLLTSALLATSLFSAATLAAEPPIRLVIHGGAGTIVKSTITPQQEAEYKAKLDEALQAGYKVLESGGTSCLDAVQRAINVMEDSPLFNAGKGAVFTHDGRNELDASIMDGKTLAAGAVAGVTTIKKPINAAYTVMTRSPHVLMVSNGAEVFLKKEGLETVDPAYFRTEHRWKQLQKAIEKEQVVLDHDGKTAYTYDPLMYDYKFGTVGAVALDKAGNLAAGTSTGGMTNKRYGRVGDSPLIGAGTYADNNTVAVSATGSGEKFIRTATAYNIASQVKYNKTPLATAANNALDEVKAIDGSGGVIVLDAKGDYTMAFNTAGMYRGAIGNDGKKEIAVFGE